MARVLASLILAVACLGACQPDASRVKVRAAASSTPGARSSAGPAAATAATLQRPPGDVRALAGLVEIDARYAADSAAGRVISNNGSGVVAIGAAGAGLAAGSNVISNNGSGIISDHAAGALPVRGVGFELLQATPPPLVGVTAPAAGMALRAYDLTTAASLSLGVDAAGKPVYEVLSDGAGKFQVFVPAGASTNVLLTATAPGSQDPRLGYTAIATSGTAGIDEDTALASDLIRRGYGRTMLLLFNTGVPDDEALKAETPEDRPKIQAGAKRLRDRVAAIGGKTWPLAKQQDVAQRIADIIMARYDRKRDLCDGSTESTFDAYARVMHAERLAVTSKMQELVGQGQDPLAFFAGRSYITRANAGRDVPYQIKKPADWVFVVGDFYITHGDLTNTQSLVGLFEAFSDLEVPSDTLPTYVAAYHGDQHAARRILYLDPDNGALPAINAVLDAAAAAP
ncbi:MAG: hypothetical protein JWM80_3082 [Cyanobacteria bacterium RYN_339]|nr:hypothetical protein [Cyanobacteria bacterium RYN_339]